MLFHDRFRTFKTIRYQTFVTIVSCKKTNIFIIITT